MLDAPAGGAERKQALKKVTVAPACGGYVFLLFPQRLDGRAFVPQACVHALASTTISWPLCPCPSHCKTNMTRCPACPCPPCRFDLSAGVVVELAAAGAEGGGADAAAAGRAPVVQARGIVRVADTYWVAVRYQPGAAARRATFSMAFSGDRPAPPRYRAQVMAEDLPFSFCDIVVFCVFPWRGSADAQTGVVRRPRPSTARCHRVG